MISLSSILLNLIYKIEFNNILELRYGIRPLVDEEDYCDYSWKNYFNFKKEFNLLNCYFYESKFNNFSEKYLKKAAICANIFFDQDCF